MHFDGNGLVSDAGAYPLLHGAFLSTPVTLQDGSRIFVVGLHSPLVA